MTGPICRTIFRFGLVVMLFFVVTNDARRPTCRKAGTMSENDVVSALLKNYRKSLPDVDGAVLVKVELHIQDVSSLNELTGEFEIDILFTQLWYDPALSFENYTTCKSNITMDAAALDKIWKPNTCLINSKSSVIHKSPTNNTMFILYQNGTIWVNYRMQVKAPCEMKLHSFPFDTQQCALVFESYSFNSEEVKLQWFDDPPITLMKEPIELPDFKLIAWSALNSTSPYPNGFWDRLEVTFIFRRRFGFFVLQAYVPTYLTIIVSWVSFSMNTELKALPARSTVGVSSLVALTYQFGNILDKLPRVSYIKALDVWMLGCIFFVFGTMVELAIVCFISKTAIANKISNNANAAKQQSAVQASLTLQNGMLPSSNPTAQVDRSPLLVQNYVTLIGSSGATGPAAGASYPQPQQAQQPLQYTQYKEHSRAVRHTSKSSRPSPSRASASCSCWTNTDQIDRISAIFFPVSFTVFNVFYWWYFLSQSYVLENKLLTETHHILS